MTEYGSRGRVVRADSFGGTGTARIGGRLVSVQSLRGGPLSAGDLVRVVALRGAVRVIDVLGRGEMLPLIASPSRVGAASGWD